MGPELSFLLMKTAGVSRCATLAAAGLILSFWVATPWSAPSQQSAERPLVIDFYALGADGASISDLKADEVTIRVNGRTRTIRNLRLVKQADLPPDNPLQVRKNLPQLPFATNGIAESGRSFVVVIDDESFRPGRERPVRAALANFLGALSPRDRVSLWTTPHGGMKVDLTQNHDRVSQAMQLVVGHGPEKETGSEGACRSRTALEATDHMLSLMAGGEGPTAVIYMTASLFGIRRDSSNLALAPGMCELTPEHFQRVGRSAASARAHFFIVQTEDDLAIRPMSSETNSESPVGGIENLAGVTGGTRMSLSRAGDQSLVAIARSTASFYSAVIDGATSDVDGAHGLDVRVSRNGVTVRSRASLHVRKPTGAAAKPVTAAEMVKSSGFYADLPLRVAGFASLDSGDGKIRVIAAAEPSEPGTKFVQMSAALFDNTGRMVALANTTEAEITQYPALSAMTVNAGTYRLRVSAVDAAGRAGAADVEVVADIVAAGPLRMSSVVLGVAREAGFLPRLQFSTEPVAIAYLDLFGRDITSPVGAIVEVLNMAGEPIVTNRLSLEPTRDQGRYRATGAVPIGALPPGDYIARVMVKVEGHDTIGVVHRTFRKVGQ